MYLFTFMTEYAFVCACMCAYVSVYFNLFKSYTTYSMYVCTYAYMHICMYACIYVCMYVCIILFGINKHAHTNTYMKD